MLVYIGLSAGAGDCSTDSIPEEGQQEVLHPAAGQERHNQQSYRQGAAQEGFQEGQGCSGNVLQKPAPFTLMPLLPKLHLDCSLHASWLLAIQ